MLFCEKFFEKLAGVLETANRPFLTDTQTLPFSFSVKNTQCQVWHVELPQICQRSYTYLFAPVWIILSLLSWFLFTFCFLHCSMENSDNEATTKIDFQDCDGAFAKQIFEKRQNFFSKELFLKQIWSFHLKDLDLDEILCNFETIVELDISFYLWAQVFWKNTQTTCLWNSASRGHFPSRVVADPLLSSDFKILCVSSRPCVGCVMRSFFHQVATLLRNPLFSLLRAFL